MNRAAGRLKTALQIKTSSHGEELTAARDHARETFRVHCADMKVSACYALKAALDHAASPATEKLFCRDSVTSDFQGQACDGQGPCDPRDEDHCREVSSVHCVQVEGLPIPCAASAAQCRSLSAALDGGDCSELTAKQYHELQAERVAALQSGVVVSIEKEYQDAEAAGDRRGMCLPALQMVGFLSRQGESRELEIWQQRATAACAK